MAALQLGAATDCRLVADSAGDAMMLAVVLLTNTLECHLLAENLHRSRGFGLQTSVPSVFMAPTIQTSRSRSSLARSRCGMRL